MNTTTSLHDKMVETFIKVDDFCQVFEREITRFSLPSSCSVKKRKRNSNLCESEVISLLISFHGGQFRNFKHFYMH